MTGLCTFPLLGLSLLLAVASGASDRDVDVSNGGDGGRSGGNGESGEATGGNGEGGAMTGCSEGEGRCSGDTPELCEGGVWVAQPPCGGATPLCSNGTCAGFRLSGHAVTIGEAPSDGSFVLLEHGFEFHEVLCGDVDGAPLCVAGGIRP